ncbi:hypothetical protein DFS34DRAFT_672187 [Phlyctochytrium arcticum]|nr:hypothetical protein DFS34DRAFT_672187 [Phlyctochytrium arcticum]
MYRQIVLNTAILSSLQNSFQISPLAIHAFRIEAFSFIQSWDSISHELSNNKLVIQEENDAPITITLPNGVYDVSTICTALSQILTSNATQPYIAEYDQVTRRISLNTSGPKDFKVLGKAGGSTSYYQLGNMDNSVSGKNVTFDNPVNLSASQPVLLTSRTFSSNGSILYPAGIESNQNILACIQPDEYGDTVTWVNPSDKFVILPSAITPSSIDYSIVDSTSFHTIKMTQTSILTIGVLDDYNDILNL